MKEPTVCFVGHGRHGKDEAALALHGLRSFRYYGSTSWAALPEIAAALHLPQQVAWETRHQNREFWKSFCDHLRRDDPCFLIRRVLANGNICAGIRDKVEVEQAIREKLFTRIVWIDRPGFPEDPTVTFGRDVATDVIQNDSSLEIFKARIVTWAIYCGFLPPTLTYQTKIKDISLWHECRN